MPRPCSSGDVSAVGRFTGCAGMGVRGGGPPGGSGCSLAASAGLTQGLGVRGLNRDSSPMWGLNLCGDAQRADPLTAKVNPLGIFNST